MPFWRDGNTFHECAEAPTDAAVELTADEFAGETRAALEAVLSEDATTPPAITISRRQFFQQLAVQGVITQDEALAAVRTGALPAALAEVVAALPANQRFAAEMRFAGAGEFLRDDPLTLAVGQAKGWSPANIDALWTAAAAL